MKQDKSPGAYSQVLMDELQWPLIAHQQKLTGKLKAKARGVNKKNSKKGPTIHAQLVHEESSFKAPAIKLLAMTDKPGPNGAQSLRAFETVSDLLKPENLFCSPEEVIKLIGDDLRVIKLLNETSKLILAAQRKLYTAFEE